MNAILLQELTLTEVMLLISKSQGSIKMMTYEGSFPRPIGYKSCTKINWHEAKWSTKQVNKWINKQSSKVCSVAHETSKRNRFWDSEYCRHFFTSQHHKQEQTAARHHQ